MTGFKNLDGLRAAVGSYLGHTDWIEITQEKIDLFGKLTEDEQWIHHDVERATKTPLGSTVAHGYFMLALIAPAVMKLAFVETAESYLNYGLNKVRFPSPVKSNSRIRGKLELVSVDDFKDGVLFAVQASIEVEGQEKPGCVANVLTYAKF